MRSITATSPLPSISRHLPRQLRLICSLLRVAAYGMVTICCMPSLHASTRLSTDVIYMKNGDVVTCELRSLSQGQLTIKQSYANATVALDWRDVERVQTSQPFIVTDASGVVFSGSLLESRDHILHISGTRSGTIPHDLVVSIEETGETFLRRFHGDVDLGIEFAQSNAQKNLTLQADLTYQTAKHIFAVNSSEQFASQLETKNTSETSIKTELFTQLRRSKWYEGGIANFLSSSEQQVSLRTTLGGALAVRPILSNRNNLTVIGGLAYTVEKNSPQSSSTAKNSSLDATVALQFATFRFDSTDFKTTVWVYPSLTSWGRVRMTLNQDVYFKFYRDFYVRASFYDNYDSRPAVSAPPNNLGVSSTLGWSFR